VIFLGDLLDEGSVATDEKYEEYVNRFYAVFQKARESKVRYPHLKYSRMKFGCYPV
jgi:hypothetical protein